MKRKGIITIVIGLIVVACLIAVFFSGSLVGAFLQYRNHWSVGVTEAEFTESNKEVRNPNRGFYSLLGFIIRDETLNNNFYQQQLGTQMYDDFNALSLIHINLMRYQNGPITEAGLNDIRSLFQALASKDKQYIIRFTYDWDGKATETEPEDVQIILEHMRQLKAILEEYKAIIFAVQGIFVGAYGEMHGSNHMSEESMQLLMQQWTEIVPEGIFLSVRTPQHWRMLTGYSGETAVQFDELSRRLGLYNDGMMGTEQDTGTYGIFSKAEVGPSDKWSVEEELEFQEELCKYVPNGGEVIIENPVNNFENAVQRMRTMHVTYLNQAYDKNVLDKWEASTVTEEGCYYGMDGLNYVKRMLGYRLLIDDAALNYEFLRDGLTVEIQMKNVGFAPLYKEPEKYLLIRRKETDEVRRYPVEAELRSLTGGNDRDQVLTVTKTLSLAGLEPGEYEVYFSIKDIDSGWYIELANEQEMQEHGYLVGAFTVEELKNPFTKEALDIEGLLHAFLDKLGEFYE